MQLTEQGRELWQQIEMDGLMALLNYCPHLTKVLNKASELQTTLSKQGVSYPTLSEHMDLINSGERQGFSLNYQKEHLLSHQQDLADLLAGRIRGDKIVGRNCGGKKAAVKWLNKQIDILEKSVNTGGIGLFLNVSNYNYYMRQAQQELAEG